MPRTKGDITPFLRMVLIGALLVYLHYATKTETYTDFEKLANNMIKSFDDAVEETTKKTIDETVIKTGMEPLRLKSTPDVKPKVAYKKNGTDEEAIANGAGWATCADSPLSKDVSANKDKAVELCEEWHRSNTPHMAFGDNSGEFVCKVINSELDSRGGQSRAKACPHVRIVDKSIA